MIPEAFSSERHHTRFHIGHSFIAIGVFTSLLLSIFLSALPSGRAFAFGTNDINLLSNQARTDNGIAALTVNQKLSNAAQAKADHMAANDYFEHTAPDGTTGWYFIGQQGYTYTMAGENLAATNESASAVVDGWMNSPGHRANLLNASFTDVGYGIAYQGDFQGYQNVYFVVALYAVPTAASTPTPTSPPQTTTNVSGSTASPASSPVGPNTGSASEPTEPTAAPTEQKLSDTAAPAGLTGTEPAALALSGTVSGTATSLRPSSYRISKETSLIIATVSAALVVAGVSIEAYRLIRHSGMHLPTHHTR